MALVNGSVPSLINGVSQQSPSVRLASQCELQENAVSSLSEGLTKRPPTEHVLRLLTDIPTIRPFSHFIDRDTLEKYLVLIQDGEILVFTIAGSPVHVEIPTPSDADYLVCSEPAKDLKAITLADTTVLVNRRITVEMSDALTDDQPHIAVIWVRAGAYSSRYKTKVAATSQQYDTDAVDPLTIKTDTIADNLENSIIADVGAGWTIGRTENVISVQKDDGTDFKCLAFDSIGNNNIKAITQTAQRFSDLPDMAVNQMVVNIIGDVASNQDDYWVKFATTASQILGTGLWTETVKPSIPFQLDSATMPHLLVRQQDDALGTITGTPFEVYFEFKAGEWVERSVGDEDSNPDPSFVGKSIEDVFLYRNRLGLLADTSVVLSRSGDLFNFFRGTALSLLDDDPIDVEASHPRVVKLRHAVVFHEECTIFGDRAQFSLRGGDTLTPSTVKLTLSTEYECEQDCKPIGAGKVIFFPITSGDFSQVSEYFDDQSLQSGKNSVSITSHIPKYLTGSAAKLTATTSPEVLAVLTDDAPNSVFVYQWFWNGQEKLQSSWSTWTFGNQVFSAEFIGSLLYLVVARNGGVFLEKLDVSVGQLDPDDSTYLTHLDRQVPEISIGVIYDSATDRSTLLLPYPADTSLHCVTRTYPAKTAGVEFETVSASGSSLVVKGDVQPYAYFVGQPYTFRYRFSPFLLRSQSVTGGVVAVEEGRLQIRSVAITCEDTGYFRVETTPRFRDTSTYAFPARTLAGQGAQLGSVSLADGTVKFMVASRNNQVTIDLVNDSFLPCRFVKAEWVGEYFAHSRRI